MVEVPSDVEIYEEDQGRKSAGAVVGGCFGGWDSTDFGGKVMVASRFNRRENSDFHRPVTLSPS